MGAFLSVPMASTNTRTPVSSQVTATDATVQQAGGCTADLPERLARALYRQTEDRGEAARMDWTLLEAELTPTQMTRLTAEINELAAGLPWHSPWSEKFAQTAHINLQELKAAHIDLKKWFLSGQRDVRVVGLIDSRVIVGALGKGSSSSIRLDHVLRQTMYYAIAFGIQDAPLWIGTEYNSADAPSRDRPLPARGPLPAWVASQWSGKATPAGNTAHPQRAREFDSGIGELTKALNKESISAQGYEAYPPPGYDKI